MGGDSGGEVFAEVRWVLGQAGQGQWGFASAEYFRHRWFDGKYSQVVQGFYVMSGDCAVVDGDSGL